MKKLIKTWKMGVYYLVRGNLISFYTFFTIILAEVAFLWSFETKEIAGAFTVVLVGYIANVLISAWLKGYFKGTGLEVYASNFYIFLWAILFVIGCWIHLFMCITLTAISLLVTAVWIYIRKFNDNMFGGIVSYFDLRVSTLFESDAFCNSTQCVILGCPFIAFTICLAMLSAFPIWGKIAVPIIYFIMAPLYTILEDKTAAENIFELAFKRYIA